MHLGLQNYSRISQRIWGQGGLVKSQKTFQPKTLTPVIAQARQECDIPTVRLAPLEPPNPSLYEIQVFLSPKTGFQL